MLNLSKESMILKDFDIDFCDNEYYIFIDLLVFGFIDINIVFQYHHKEELGWIVLDDNSIIFQELVLNGVSYYYYKYEDTNLIGL